MYVVKNYDRFANVKINKKKDIKDAKCT